MEKLVRDKIPDIIRADTGKEPRVRIAGEAEALEALLAKLEEEMAELLEASAERWLEERADVEEVLIALDGLSGVPSGTAAKLRGLKDTLAELDRFRGVRAEELLEVRLAKREERGGFEKKIMWTKED